ncbi:MAG: 2-(1,2-epoxy,2-dihydrophenyl)acetyl-CoA isomerase [Gammaproteobacteria bacterium]|nr:2-(1,2-epoxy,2-dihydrophenyl)acetyl-CoA isomerase [Gammaproteobacteria bacterium]
MNTNTSPVVHLEFRDHVAYLTFARPNAANTINRQFGRDFLQAAVTLEAASNVRAVVLAGEGKNFCFGGDLKEMVASGDDVEAYLIDLTTNLHAGMFRLARLRAPVIAAVQGTAAGAGLGLVLVADLAIAARSAKFVSAYTGVGLSPDAGTSFLLPRAVGYKRAMELFLNNRVLDAQQALEWGMVNQVVEDDQLTPTVAALAARLAAGPVDAYGAVKRLLADSEPGFEAQLGRESRSIAARGASVEGREAMAAFLEKRAPRFIDGHA